MGLFRPLRSGNLLPDASDIPDRYLAVSFNQSFWKRPETIAFRRQHPWPAFLLLVVVGTLLTNFVVAYDSPSASAAPMEAKRIAVSQPRLRHAVYFQGHTYSAGLSSYRIDRALTVPAFSLGLEENAFGTKLYATFAKGNGIAHMPALTILSESWSQLSAKEQVSPVIAAAFQVAIWNRSADLPVNRTTVPDSELRGLTKKLLRELPEFLEKTFGPDSSKWVERCLDSNCGEDPASPEMLARVGDSTVEDQIIDIELQLGNLELSFNSPQAIDLRLGEAYAVVCTGTVVHIEAKQSAIEEGAIPPCSPGSGRSENRHYQTSVISDRRCIHGKFEKIKYNFESSSSSGTLTCVKVQPRPLHGECPKRRKVGTECNVGRINQTSTGYASVHFPRDKHIKYVHLSWNVELDPGDVFAPVGAGESIITVDGGILPVTRTVRLNPSDLAGLQAFLETTVVAEITSWGTWGLVALGVGLIFILCIPRLLAFSGVKLWNAVNRWRQRRAGPESKAPVGGVPSLVIETQGRSVDGAISRGLRDLGLADVALVEIEVLQRPVEGLFGRMKLPARVRLKTRSSGRS